MFQRRLCALLSILLALVSGPARAATPIRLVTGPDYAPFADPALPSGGLTAAIVLAAFAAADVPVEPLQFEPWKRGYGDLLAGSFDAAFPYIRAPQRELEMLYSDAIYDIVSIALFRAGTGHDYLGPESLNGLSLCLPIGFASAPPVAALIKAELVHLEQPASADLCLKELAAGRVDVFVSAADLIDLRAAVLFGPSPPFLRGKMPVYHQSLHLIAARERPGAAELIRRFNDGLSALRANGRYDEIVKRQLGAS
jgi:polar amino acid transport system substrate-binding protein